jgi:hypothetical protein
MQSGGYHSGLWTSDAPTSSDSDSVSMSQPQFHHPLPSAVAANDWMAAAGGRAPPKKRAEPPRCQVRACWGKCVQREGPQGSVVGLQQPGMPTTPATRCPHRHPPARLPDCAICESVWRAVTHLPRICRANLKTHPPLRWLAAVPT